MVRDPLRKTPSDEIQKRYNELVDFLVEIRKVCRKHNMSLVANDYSISVDRSTGEGYEFIGDISEVSVEGSIDSMINFVDGEKDFLLFP